MSDPNKIAEARKLEFEETSPEHIEGLALQHIAEDMLAIRSTLQQLLVLLRNSNKI